MSQSDMWRWADEQGEQRLVSADELRSAIASGVLPASTLVWRDGMTAWVPASTVPDLAPSSLSGTQSLTAERPIAGTNPAAGAPTRSTLQGLAAAEIQAAVKAQIEKDAPKEKRTPSVAPPRPTSGSVKPPAHVKTLRPNFGPAIPAAPRLPSETPAKPAPAPRPAVAPRAPVAPAKTPAPAPAARAPSTSAIDKDWAITEDETTNVPEKNPPVAARPEPPVEAAAPQAQPSRESAVRTAPPPSPHTEHRPADESTESATFQFAKNTLSLRVVKPSGGATEGQNRHDRAPSGTGHAPAMEAPPGLMESYGKQAGPVIQRGPDEPPPTAPSADLGVLSDDGIPAYANTTIRLDPLPEPPKVREPTATTMLPIDFQTDPLPESDDDPNKKPHEVSRTIRLAADFLSKVLGPGKSQKTAQLDLADPEIQKALMQIKPPPLPPPASAFPQDPGQFVRLQPGTPHAATSLALRAVKSPQGEAPPPAQLPLNALLISGGTLILMVIGAFFVGRCSVKPTPNGATAAKKGFSAAAQVLQDNLPQPPKPCWVVKQPSRWAGSVSKNVPFDLRVLASGKIAVGYAKNDDEAVGFEVAQVTGQVTQTYVDKAKSDIARVTPVEKGFFISTQEPSGSLRSMVPVSGDKQFYLGISDKHLAFADQPSGAANRIWPIDDDDASGGIRVASLGKQGILMAIRTGSSRQKKVFAGLIGLDRKPISSLVNVVGSGGLAGDPMVGSNGREVAVVFADQAGEQSAWKMRIGHAAIGKIPTTTTVFEAPSGGPGGDANFPSIGGLSDGRWVLVWTEGSSNSKVVRAQTFATNFTAVGDPIVLSPPAGNYGPSMVGVVGSYVTVVFVAKGRSNNELWGSVLQCG